MKVSHLYKHIDLSEVNKMAVDDSYWTGVYKFLNQIWEQDIQQLSPKQMAWLERIDEQLERGK